MTRIFDNLTEIEKMFLMSKGIETMQPRKTLAPTYRGIVPLIIAALTDGTDKGKAAARAELYQMADLADKYNASITDD